MTLQRTPRERHFPPPPRTIPIGAHTGLRLGSFSSRIGWTFVGFGMVFVWLFGMRTAPVARLAMMGELATTEGVVESREETSFTTGKGSSKRYTWRVQYRYRAGDKQELGDSYGFYPPDPGAVVNIEYLPLKPTLSRIEGMEVSPVSLNGLLVFLFPLVGLGSAVSGWREGSRAARLLRSGQQTTAKFVSKRSTGSQSNKRPEYELTFALSLPEPETFGGHRRPSERAAKETRFVVKTFDPATVEDEPEEPALFDPSQSGNAILLDALPGKVRFRNGTLQAPSNVLNVALPVLTVLVHGLIALAHFG